MSWKDGDAKHIAEGPWGGQYGSAWDDGVYSTVKQVVITSAAGIVSIQFEYDDNGNSVWSQMHGGTSGVKKDTVNLAYPLEFLVSISGTFGPISESGTVTVRSLSFVSNRRKYGPFGTEQGMPFSLPTSGGKIVGFHGRSSWYLDSIGVHVKPLLQKNLSETDNVAHGKFKVSDQTHGADGKFKASDQTHGADGKFKVSDQIHGSDGKFKASDQIHGSDGKFKASDQIHGSDGKFKASDHIQGAHGKIKVSDHSPGEHGKFNASDQSQGSHGKFKASDQISSSSASNSPEQHKLDSEDITAQGGNGHQAPSNTEVVTTTPCGKRVLKCGPWGSKGGGTFDDGIYNGVREIRITRTGALVSICVCYDKNGKAVWRSKNGGSGGLTLEKIVFDYPYEVLTHISGYYGSTILRGPTVVKSITFHTNMRTYGPFGDKGGFFFSSSARGRVVGFHGRRGYVLMRSIGVYVLAEQPMPPQSRPDPFNMSSLQTSGVVWGVPREQVVCSVGPWGYGGVGAKPWDDGENSGVRQITLTRGHAICSIQIEYDRSGHSIWSAQHGTSNDFATYQIKFDYPYEFLTSISGYFDAIPGERQIWAVRSLTLQTNRRKHGPYGKELGTYFSSAKTEGRIVGFHGRSGHFLDAIGVHVLLSADDEGIRYGYHKHRGAFRAMVHNIAH